MMRTDWRLPFGANLIGQEQTQFRIWAPAQRTMSVAIEGAAPLPCRDSDDGWFEVEANCGAGARYRYILPDGTAVPDPAARAQHGDVHGASIVVDPLRLPLAQSGLARAAVARGGALRSCTPACSAASPASRANCRALPRSASPPSS